jgi:hypothetical protein
MKRQRRFAVSAEPSLEEAKREFLERATPFMLAKFYKAETYGVDWRRCKLEELDFYNNLAEEATKPSPIEVME